MVRQRTQTTAFVIPKPPRACTDSGGSGGNNDDLSDTAASRDTLTDATDVPEWLQSILSHSSLPPEASEARVLRYPDSASPAALNATTQRQQNPTPTPSSTPADGTFPDPTSQQQQASTPDSRHHTYQQSASSPLPGSAAAGPKGSLPEGAQSPSGNGGGKSSSGAKRDGVWRRSFQPQECVDTEGPGDQRLPGLGQSGTSPLLRR